MSRSQLVAEHLPLLRRYARALTGNQASGDAYVGAMLEALLQDPALLDARHGARAGLFRLFTQIWNSVSVNDNPDVASSAVCRRNAGSQHHAAPRQAACRCAGRFFGGEGGLHSRYRRRRDRVSPTARREMARKSPPTC
jgi:hypothetical protein